ncbi:hypothetical protein [Pseudomonas sp. COW5]|uniref:hypothetical protein n=1 Tax=Pseudomonas sp. COW5 TaxID=2981253 RepID=UPI002247DD6B|nr:hypothetical protein [Pseudomonas sp. COW5]MCX2545079.1 hypothetical protein [Pseudomonas sp. COW5]
MPETKTLSNVLTGLLLLLAASIPALVAHYSEAFPFYWNISLLSDLYSWAGMVLTLAAVLKFTRYKYSNHVLIGGLFVFAALGTGLQATLSSLLFICSSCILGRWALGFVSPSDAEKTHFLRALLVGITLYIALFSTLIHFPINTRLLYFGILLAPFLALAQSSFRSALSSALRNRISGGSERIRTFSFRSVIACTFIIGYVLQFAFFPSIGSDDNVLHLRMWTELANTQVFSFNIQQQIWSVAPFAFDLLHSIVSILANADARGGLNLTFTVLLIYTLWSLTSSLLKNSSDSLLVVLLFCSTPIIAPLLIYLQTELFLAFLVTSAVKILLETETDAAASKLIAIVSVAALCAATKLPGMVLGVLVFAAYIPVFLKERDRFALQKSAHPILACTVLIAIFSFSALQSYGYSWITTGNPFFPLYNEIFKSPYYPLVNFADPLYQKGFTLQSFWALFYNTSKHYESLNFVAGFQYLYLLPLGLVALIASRKLSNITKFALVLPTVGFGLVMFSAAQYWRYLFPILPLASVVLGCLMLAVSGTAKRMTRWVFMFFIAVNIYFLPGIAWFLTTPAQDAFTDIEKSSLTEQLAPSKAITDYLNSTTHNPVVLYDVSASFGATLRGQPIYISWYSPSQTRAFGQVKNIDDIATIIEKWKVQYVIWNSSFATSLPNRQAMLGYLTMHGQPVYQLGPIILYKLSKDKIDYQTVYNLRNQSESVKDIATSQGFTADTTPKVVSTIDTQNSRSAKYEVTFECSSNTGSFIAQINWNVLPVYYKLIPCSQGRVTFSETLPIPVGATSGNVYITARDRDTVNVVDLTVGVVHP